MITKEIAELLDVTEEFLEEAISTYREKYGVYTTLDDYVVYFVPNLVISKFECECLNEP